MSYADGQGVGLGSEVVGNFAELGFSGVFQLSVSRVPLCGAEAVHEDGTSNVKCFSGHSPPQLFPLESASLGFVSL